MAVADHVAACKPQALGRVYAEGRSGEAVAEPEGMKLNGGTEPIAGVSLSAGLHQDQPIRAVHHFDAEFVGLLAPSDQ